MWASIASRAPTGSPAMTAAATAAWSSSISWRSSNGSMRRMTWVRMMSPIAPTTNARTWLSARSITEKCRPLECAW